MAYEPLRTARFEYDYSSILDYLRYDLGSPQRAAHLVKEMSRIKSLLVANPFINAVSSKEGLSERGFREQIILNYVIIYSVTDSAVIFARMFHQSQDYESRFLQNS